MDRIDPNRGRIMFRRVLAGAAAAAMVVLVPSTAHALDYTGPDEDVAVSETNPAPGEPFKAIVDAEVGSAEATLTVTSESESTTDDEIEIAGSQSMTKATDAQGQAGFTVTLYAEDNYTLTGYDEAGNVVGQAVVVVGDGNPGDVDDTDDDTTTPGVTLPNTGMGAGTAVIAGTGAALLVIGGFTLVASRRRRTTLG
jgi:LPXTG-motif cell wall-anchored protein